MMCVVFEVNSVCLCVGGGIGKVFKGPNQSELPQQCSHKINCVVQSCRPHIHTLLYWQKIIYMYMKVYTCMQGS